MESILRVGYSALYVDTETWQRLVMSCDLKLQRICRKATFASTQRFTPGSGQNTITTNNCLKLLKETNHKSETTEIPSEEASAEGIRKYLNASLHSQGRRRNRIELGAEFSTQFASIGSMILEVPLDGFDLFLKDKMLYAIIFVLRKFSWKTSDIHTYFCSPTQL